MPAGLGQRPAGEQVPGTLDQPLVEGADEPEVAAGHVAHGREAAAQRPLEPLRCRGGDVAGWRGLDLEHVEADPVGVEVGVDQPGDDEPASASMTSAPAGARRRGR